MGDVGFEVDGRMRCVKARRVIFISFSFGMQKAKLHCFLQYKIQSYYRLKKLAF